MIGLNIYYGCQGLLYGAIPTVAVGFECFLWSDLRMCIIAWSTESWFYFRLQQDVCVINNRHYAGLSSEVICVSRHRVSRHMMENSYHLDRRVYTYYN